MGFLTTCPICHGDFSDGRAYTGTSGVVFRSPHPLYDYCDTGLHLACLETWPHREAFAEGYFLAWRVDFQAMGRLLAEGAGWILGCGPAVPEREPSYVEVDLSDWPCRLYTLWADWESYLAGGYQQGLEGGALAAADRAMAAVRLVAPDLPTLRRLRLACLAARPDPSRAGLA